MKLHLPTRLRKAVVASIVAVASLATTLSTTTLFATGAVAWSLAAFQAQALNVTENTDWDTDQTITEEVQLDGDIRVDLNAGVTVQGTLRMKNSAELAVHNGGILTINKLDLHNAQNGNTEELIIEAGAKVYITGEDATSGTGWAAATIGHWGDGTGKVTMSGGELSVRNGTFHLGWDSEAYMDISGGTANLYKLLYSSSTNYPNKTATLTLSGTGILNIGAGGISHAGAGPNKNLVLNGGTVGALDNWTLSGNLNIQLGGAVTFDTDEYNVDVQTAIAGAGSITKVGTGELSLVSVNGEVVVSEGTLRLGSCVGLTSMTIKSGATAYLPSVSVSSTSTDWVEDWIYYTASAGGVDMSLLTVEEGGNVVASAGGSIIAANAEDRVYADASCLAPDGSLTIERGNVMVCDPNNITAVAESIASASKIILDGGTLFSLSNRQVEETVDYVIETDIEIKAGGGTLRAYENDTTNTSDSTTYTGDIIGNGTLHKTDGGRIILSGSLSGFTGSIDLSGGILDIAGDTSSNVLISGGGTLYISGNLTKEQRNGENQTIQTNTRISSGGKLIAASTDLFRWNSKTILTLEEGAEFAIGATRQTSGYLEIVMNGGTISGVGVNFGGGMSALDYHNSSTITVNADSTISANINVQNGKTLTLKVAEGKTLATSGVTHNSGKLILAATTDGGTAGTVLVTGANLYSGGTDINSGTIELQEAGALGSGAVTMAANTKLKLNNAAATTHANTITGDATSEITKTGTAAITLSGVTNFAGTVRISGGSLGFTQAATLGALVTDGGSLLVDAAAPAVLTLGAAPTGTTSLLVKNAASIADGGVRIFADGTPMPGNSNVLVNSIISADADGNEWVAAYADGMLTKTAVAAASAGALTWKTDGASNNWGLTTEANWTKDSAAQRWVDASTVTFAGTGESIRVVSAVTADSATVSGTGYEWVLGADKLTITNGVTIAENAALTITGMTNSNYEGIITGAGTLTLKGVGHIKPGDAFMQKVLSDSAALGTVVLTDGSGFNIEGSDHRDRIKNITHIVVENGARFDHRYQNQDLVGAATGADITIAGAGNASFTGPAAALTFGYNCAASQTTFNLARKVILADDATIWVRSGATSDLTGGLDTATYALTVAGGGTLKSSYSADATISALAVNGSSTFEVDALNLSHDSVSLQGSSVLTLKAKNVEIDDVVLDGSEFVYHRKEDNNAQKLTIGNVISRGNSTLKATYCKGFVEINNLAGNGELTVDFNHDQAGVATAKVGGSADFNGVIKIKQTNTHASNARQAIFGTADHDALAGSEIVLDSVSSAVATSKIGFVLANTSANLAETIQIAGISTGAGIDVAKAVIVSQDGVSIASDGDMRTLEILGSGSYEFNGTMLIGVNLLMNGSGTQSFEGNLDAFNGSIAVQKGTLNLAKVANTTGITLAGAGATLGVTEGVSGKSLTATAVGAVLSADLTMAGGSLALGATDAEWAKTGGLSLDGHKLVIDTAHLGALSANLGAEDYTGEVVQLLTNVAGIEDAAGNAISITGTTKVGDLFNTGSDTSLADYLLNWDAANGTLSLIMKGEVANLVWNDASEQNEWKNAGTHTNWKDGADDSRFTLGDNVTFSGTGEEVTIVGTVNPLNVTVSSGDYTWTDTDSLAGSVEAAGKLTVGNAAHTTAQLKIANSGKKSFAGGVEVLEGAYLEIKNATGWNGKVSGAGQLILSCGGELNLSDFIDTAESAPSLAELKIVGDSTIKVENAEALNALKNVSGEFILADIFAGAATLSVTENATMTSNKVKVNGLASIDVAADKNLNVDARVEVAESFGGLVLHKKGAGTLTLTGGASALQKNAGIKLHGGTLKIADAGKLAESTLGTYDIYNISLNDADNGSGTLLLQNGKLNVFTLGSAANGFNVEVCTVNAGDVVQLGGFTLADGTTSGGVNGSDLDKITLVQGTQLTGVQGDITVGGTGGTTSALALTLDAVNVGTASTIATGKNAMIDQTGKLIINDGTVVTLSVDAIASMLSAAATNSESVYLHLTTGTLEVADAAMGALVFKSGATSIDLLETFGVRLNGTEGGSLKLSGGAVGIYTAAEDSTVSGYKVLSAYQSTVVAPGKSLEMVLDGAANDGSTAVVNNLIGGTDSTLLISNTDDASTARVELKNKLQAIDNPDPAEAVGADTEFAGDIDGTSGAGDVEIVISGDGTLTVGGNVNTAQLTMSEGGLTLNGNDNTIGSLADDGVAAGATTADSTLTVNDLLTVEGESELTGTSLVGDGTLLLKESLKLSNAAALDGVAVELQNDNFGDAAALALDGVTGNEVSALDGAGSLQGGNGADLTVTGKGGSFSGSLDALAGSTGGATLKIAEGASQTLDRVTGSTAWSVENAGELTINITNPAVTTGTGTNKPLTLDSLTMKSGSTTTMVLNTDAPAKYLNLQELVVEDGAKVALQSTGLNEIDFGGSITLAYAANGVTVGDDVAVDLGNSTAFKKVKEATLVSSADGKSLVLQTAYHDENQYEKMASSDNAAAGAALLWSVNTGALPNGSALKAVDEAVNALSKQGSAAAAAQADKIMAAVAGSSTAILGSALSSDVERQLRAIRNRTTTMGVAQTEVNEGMPYVNAWLNAEGDHHEMDADGLAAGYTRDSWGGTVGFDVDLTPSFTMGLAVTAMYGDIESEAADKAEGDFDTQYLSLFARYSSNAWTHTFVATVGRADITLDRTVNYGTGIYETTGDTEGTSFGFMYEVGRVFALTEDGDVCLQPVANVTFRHSSVDGYEESGCDATVAVDEQTYSAVTLGVGARLQAVIGTSIYNRASILEARALAKFDMGDREGETDVRLTQGGDTATVKSAELGAFGAEFGVGVTVPVGTNAGSIFVDGSAEIRSGYTNINGTVGYRINF